MKKEIDFLGKARIAITFSTICILGSIFLWFSKGDSKYGVDFLGGTEVVLKIDKSTSSDIVRNSLNSAGITDSVVQNFETNDGSYAIRLAGSEQDLKDKVKSALSSLGNVEILSTSFVGPIIGEELKNNAIIATILGLIIMLIYITVRFEFAFAVGAVFALFHDVVVSLGAIVLLGQQVNMATVAAALTIVGYSVNDTIVIFDRVREEIFNGKDTDLVKLVNRCLNLTLSRTIITSLLTWFSVLALLFIGGGSIRELSLFLAIGIVAGSYSTIYIASPIAIAWENFRNRKNVK